ncbi:BamA/TamA family outer membrane protein [Mesonia aquimarina]|uniref:BamA/TamA family outer membrane protein n=1 Tax=Mesonia aquimarina TaxID=1504967 RepID=UPI000EF599E8|nr:BamA/TamA family outer membrane protein [Mesonia aquimarina]
MKKILLILLCILTENSFAQQEVDVSVKKDSVSENSVEFTVMPYVSYNRNLKAMFGVIPMLMYDVDKTDTISPPSISGVAGVYTTNKSYFFTGFTKIYLQEDHWRLSAFVVLGDYNSQFYVTDAEVPGFYDYATKAKIISVDAQRKIVNDLFAGISLTHAYYETDYFNGKLPSTTELNSLEGSLLLDKRNDIYYPTQGYRAKLKLETSPEWLGNELASDRIIASLDHYLSMRENKDVLAARLSGKIGLGEVPFERQISIGGKDIRGYSEGKFRGNGLLALQGEYRWNFSSKMGLVGFGGLSTLYGSENESFDWDLYPGAGVGYRYKAFKKVKFNIGLDVAVGKDDFGVYFRIGESF